MKPLLAVMTLVAAMPLGHLQPQPPPATVFRGGIDVVRLDVSIVRNGRPVRGLSAADFIVTDNGVQQVVESVDVDQLPLSVQLVLDVSGSVFGDRLEHLIAAADGLVASLRPGERAAVLTFSHRFHVLVEMTEDLASVRQALRSLVGEGRTALRDAVQLAMATRHGEGARPLVLVFSDGVDNSSWLSEEAVVESARRAGVVIHLIRVAGQERSGSRFVEQLTETTGGRVWSARSDADLQRLFTTALEEMRGRYLLSFSSQRPVRPGWHALSVRLKNGGGDITARSGYFVTP
jgi:Ca-activated chloride channel homolog